VSGLAFGFRTGRRSPHVAPVSSGRFAYLEMSDRRSSGKRPMHSSDRERHLDRRTAEAREWARRAGFSEEQVPRAAQVALFLRGQHGEGNVTAGMVRELLGGAV
jgi:hypothetical protein